MKQFIDFIPLVIFFVLYKTTDIFIATGALIVATAIQLIVTYLIYKKVEKVQLIVFAVVAVMGGMTIFFQNDSFIKWKVTVVYAFFSIGLLVADAMGKPVIKGLLGKEMTLPEFVWKRINIAWVLFFFACALLNIYVAFHMSQETWVNFKVFGLLITTFIFTMLTGVYVYRFLPKEDETSASSDADKLDTTQTQDKSEKE